MMAALLLVVAGLLCCASVHAAGACEEKDWTFSFGVCHEGFRNIYASGGNCDEGAKDSAPRPPPLANISCEEHCPAGKALGVQQVDGKPELYCKACPPGRFSLGGGQLISGVAGDWHRAWPPGLRSTCTYLMSDGTMLAGAMSRGRAPNACSLTLMSPSSVAGAYPVELQTPASEVSLGMQLQAPVLRLAPGDRRLCIVPNGHAASSAQPARSPFVGPFGPGRGGRRLGAATQHLPFFFLAATGGCSLEKKSRVAKAIGAAGVLLANNAAIRVGARPPTAGRGGTQLHASHRARVPVYKMLENGDAQIIAAALHRFEEEQILINMTSLRMCKGAIARQEAPVSQAPSPNASQEREYGCEPWVPDEKGLSIHSGDNRRFDRITSILEFAVNIVQEYGYVLFRYKVDAENGYDGFSFDVDWMEILPLVSVQKDWKDVQVNLTMGAHTLRWNYAKDYSNNSGMDRAELQLVQVVGTAHADLECFNCHGSGTHSAGGADHCNACQRNEFLDADNANLAKCSPCPAGKWSPAGSILPRSCQDRRTCTKDDVKVSFLPCKNGKRKRMRSWLQPSICEFNDPSAAQLLQDPNAEQEFPCPACEPYLERGNSGGDCRPRLLNCPRGSYEVTELVLSQWTEWPQNLSQTVTGPHGLEEGEASIVGGWQLEGRSMTVNMAAAGGTQGQLDAQLHLDVKMLLSPGNVSFVLEVSQTEWGSQVQFLLNGVALHNLPSLKTEMLPARGHGKEAVKVSGPLWPGTHRLTWQCLHAASGKPSSGHRIRLVNVSVTGAAEGGAARCEPCPPGHEVAPDGMTCRRCAPGQQLIDGSCSPCPAGTYSQDWAAQACLSCGEGTQSSAGASTCTAMPMLVAPQNDSSGSSQTIMLNTTPALQHWDTVTGGRTGPYLVAGRKFFIGLHAPVEPPGDEEGAPAFVWEQVSRACSGNGRGSSIGGGPASSVARVGPPPPALRLGAVLQSAEAVALGNVRGVQLSWAKELSVGDSEQDCPDTAGLSPEALRGFSLLIRCDPNAPWPSPAAEADASGNLHLDQLRVARPDTGSVGKASCGKLVLEWPSLMACPGCRWEDYAAAPGSCRSNKRRTVTFVRSRPCLGGQRPPPAYEETCGEGNDAGTIISGVKQAVKRDYPIRSMIFVAATILLGCSLIAYATYLHRRYRHLYLQDGL